MPRKPDNLTGQRFGNLVVVGLTSERKRGYAVWECRCDCGNTVLVQTNKLKGGEKTSCGCKSRPPLDGQRFGRLTVLRPIEKRINGQVAWECLCDCGNTIFSTRNRLTNGKTHSCGCLQKDRLHEIGKQHAKDLTGQRFGRLVAVRPTEDRRHEYVVWECLCDCGNTHFAISRDLLNGHVKSCGCFKVECLRENGKRGARDLTGQRFGRLTAIRPTERRENRSIVWECACDCGNTRFATSADLIYGSVKSCGCLPRGRKKSDTLL